MRDDSEVRVALVRWGVIAAATDVSLGPVERGLLLAEIAATVHRDADGRAFRVTKRTLYRWLAAWRRDGFEGLKPTPRRDAGTFRADAQILELAAALRREAPARSAAHIAEILERTRDAQVHPRTLQRFFADRGLERARLEGRHRAYGRFEAAACGDLWIADAWDGPPVGQLSHRHAQLFSVIDDTSRLICHGGFYPDVSERSFQHCLRTAIARRGVPRRLYVDNGSAFVSLQLKLICARLGIQLVHSKPYRPQGRGKKERFYRTVAEQFAVEIEVVGVDTLVELNRWWASWVEQVYHQRIHHSTGQSPLQRWSAAANKLTPAPAVGPLAAAFRWSATRTVTKTASVSLHGNHYTVEPALVGYRVELRYDPEDLTDIAVVCNGKPRGQATPRRIGVHVDPKLKKVIPAEPGPTTGIAYLDAVAADHAATLTDSLTYINPADATDHNNDNHTDAAVEVGVPADPIGPDTKGTRP